MPSSLRRSSAAFLLAAALASPTAAPAQGGGQVSRGSCSPNIAYSSVSHDVVINCAANTPELRRIQASLSALLKKNATSDREREQLLKSLNDLLGLRDMLSHQGKQLDHIVELLDQAKASGKPTALAQQVDGLVQETLARNIQKIGPLKVTLTGVQSTANQVTVYFSVVNEGIQDQRQTLIGPGSFNYGSSSIYVAGQKVPASGIALGGPTMPVSVQTTFIPGVPMDGRVEFRGVRVRAEDIAVFELAYSFNHLKPAGYARFRLAD